MLAKDLEFEFFIEEDSIHGFMKQDGNWTGLIGSLVDQVSLQFSPRDGAACLESNFEPLIWPYLVIFQKYKLYILRTI